MAELDFAISDIVVGAEALRAADRSTAADLIRLVVADLPKSPLHMDEVVSFVRSHYPNARVMFVAGSGAVGAECPTMGAVVGFGSGESPAATVAPAAAETGRRFSPRQAQVAKYLVQGLSNKEIARHLDLSESTVKVHVVSIFRALDVRSRARAVSAILSSPVLQRELGL